MTTLHETAYPSLKPDPTPRELAELYTPTKDEQLLAAGIGKRALPRMAALIHLKVFQRLGYFISLAEVPPVIREHIAQQVGVVRPPPAADLKRFEASGSRTALFATLRRHLNVKPMNPGGHAWLEVVADTAAETRSEEHTSELQSQSNLVCRLLLEKKKKTKKEIISGLHSSKKKTHYAGYSDKNTILS